MSTTECSECGFEFHIGADAIKTSPLYHSLKAENELLRGAADTIDNFATHPYECNITAAKDPECSCGLGAAREALAKCAKGEQASTLQVTPEKLKDHLDKNYSSETFKRQVMRIFEELKI